MQKEINLKQKSTSKIDGIRERCHDARPIRSIDIKYLLDQLTERDKEIEWLRGKHNQAALNWQQENQECRKLQAEIKQLREVNSTLENDLINANMNLERMTELVEAQRWIPVSERLPELDKYGEAYVLVSMDDEFIATTTYTKDGFELWADSGEVVAWQPLPEPYKEVSDAERN